jgi:hypothetical protein
VTAPASTTAAPLPTEPPLFLLLHDTFDTGELPLWTLGAGWVLVPSEGGLALQGSGSEAVTFVHNTLGDVVVQARFLMSAGGARLSVRQSAAGAYTASLDVNGQVALYRGDVLLGAATVSPIAAGQWRVLRLSAIGGALRVAVDGVEVIAVIDSNPLPATPPAVRMRCWPRSRTMSPTPIRPSATAGSTSMCG